MTNKYTHTHTGHVQAQGLLPSLASLHWLPIHVRLYSVVPTCLIFRPYTPNRTLRPRILSASWITYGHQTPDSFSLPPPDQIIPMKWAQHKLCLQSTKTNWKKAQLLPDTLMHYQALTPPLNLFIAYSICCFPDPFPTCITFQTQTILRPSSTFKPRTVWTGSRRGASSTPGHFKCALEQGAKPPTARGSIL